GSRKWQAARVDMCGFEPAPSVTLIAVTTPRKARARAMNSEGSVETGGESSAVTTKLPSRKRRWSSLTGLLEDCSFSANSILVDIRSAASVARRASATAALGVDARHELRSDPAQTLLCHATATRHVVVREPPRLEFHLLREFLVPVRARVRRREDLVHDRPALALERLERTPQVVPALREGANQC